jgi:cell division protein FtsI/penicillin-binding protein 2
MDVKKDIVFRLSTIYVIAAIIAFAIIIRIFVLQFVQNKEYEETEEKVQYKTEKPHLNGEIFVHGMERY